MNTRAGRFREAPLQRAAQGWTAIIVFAVSIALLAFPEPRGQVQGLANQALVPLQRATSWVNVRVGSFVETVGRAGDLTAQNRTYRDEIDRLQAQLLQMRELEGENKHLRELLGLRERLPPGNLLPGQVIARDPLALVHAIVIDRGGDDGVALNQPVIIHRGIAGRIVEVHARSAKALLITDVNSALSVRTQGADPQATGLVRGLGDGRLLLQYVPPENLLRVGDTLVTSGVGGVFPPGLLVGRILQIRQADVSVFQEAMVEPAVKLRDLEQVYILTRSGLRTED